MHALAPAKVEHEPVRPRPWTRALHRPPHRLRHCVHSNRQPPCAQCPPQGQPRHTASPNQHATHGGFASQPRPATALGATVHRFPATTKPPHTRGQSRHAFGKAKHIRAAKDVLLLTTHCLHHLHSPTRGWCGCCDVSHQLHLAHGACQAKASNQPLSRAWPARLALRVLPRCPQNRLAPPPRVCHQYGQWSRGQPSPKCCQ